jgi:hypothetical protein
LFLKKKKITIFKKFSDYTKKTKNLKKKILKKGEIQKNNWEISSKKVFVLNFRSKDLKNIFINFFMAKKFLNSRKICSVLEKIFSNWLDKNYCFIFKKKIIKI